MALTTLAAIVAAGAGGGYLYKRRLGRASEATATELPAAETVGEEAVAAVEERKGWLERAKGQRFDRPFDRLRTTLRRGKSQPAAVRFMTWVAALPGADEAHRTWLAGLTTLEIETLMQQTSAFLSDMLEVDLAWLLDGQIDADPGLKAQVEQAVLNYCRAYRHAIQARDEVAAVVAFQAWQKNPQKHSQLGRQLLTRLVEAELVTLPADIYLASEKEIRHYADQAIREAAEKDGPAFHAILKDVVAAVSGKAAEPAEAARQAAPAAEATREEPAVVSHPDAADGPEVASDVKAGAYFSITLSGGRGAAPPA
jgi:hypothetical protein